MSLWKAVIIISILVTVVGNVHSLTCQNGWIEHKDFCYLFHNVTSTLYGHSQKDSRLICQRLGGDLLSIADKNESDFISAIFINDPIIKYQHYWIGLNDLKKESVYEWTDGTPFNASVFQNWRSNVGEPNNFNNEDCAESTWDGKWNDNACFREFGFICKRKKNARIPIAPTLPPFPNVTTQPTTCEAGWIPWGTSCYGIIRRLQKTWQDARSDCLRRFGDLVIIETAAEQQFLTNEVSTDNSEFWIGLSDQSLEGTFLWVNGVKSNYSNWGNNEPSNDFGGEDCVEIYGKWNPGKWNDNHCASIRDYICEKQSGIHNCPEGWKSYGDYCYQINAHPALKRTWNESRSFCHDFNKNWEDKISVAEADLVSIKSEDEEKMLLREFRDNGVTDRLDAFWTGLNNLNSRKEFEWSDKTFLNYTHWKTTFSKDGQCVQAKVNGLIGWEKASCSKKNLFACKVKRGKDRCYGPLGLQNYDIPDSSITANSQLSITTPATAARLYLKKGNSIDGAWCASNSTKTPWLQINFGSPQQMTYMGLQGKSNSDALVTSFYLRYSLDGTSWSTYGDIPPHAYYQFRAYTYWRDHNERVVNLPLPTPFIAQYVRIYPLKWKEACCMRVEFYGCQADVNNQQCGVGWTEEPVSKNCYKFSKKKTSWDAAQSICATQGGDLVSITSPQEQKFVNEKIKALSGRHFDFWSGLNDLDKEGVFQWKDFSPLLLVNWYKDSPRKNSGRTNCVAIRASDGFWKDEDCTSIRNFACKRKYISKLAKKEPFNTNWMIDADYYWAFDGIYNNMVMGTVPAKAYGRFSTVNFLVAHATDAVPSPALNFNGIDNYVVIPYIEAACLSDPGASFCTHGITVSFRFKSQNTFSTIPIFILDNVGLSGKLPGFYVSIIHGRIKTFIQGRKKYYNVAASFKRGSWNHFVCTWSVNNGLKIYINGQASGTHLYGSTASFKFDDATQKRDLLVGKSRDTNKLTRIALMAVVVYEKVLRPEEISFLYTTAFGKCQWGTIPLGSYCYEFTTNELNWKDASQYCKDNGGHLMSVHSPDEQAMLSISSHLQKEIWIGLNSKQENHLYSWSDSTQVAFTNWNAYEPNNWNNNREDCVHTWLNGMWNDNLCYLSKKFVCKYKRVFIPAKGDKKKEPFNVVIRYYQRKTFGCPLSKQIRIKDARYGSIKHNCFLKENLTRSIIEKQCNGPQCTNIIASDRFFNKTNPCVGVRSWASKVLHVNYTCDEGQSAGNVLGCPTGYSVFRGNNICYKLYPIEFTFTDAQKMCNRDGATLLSIHSRLEELYFTTLTSTLTKPTDIWIGLKYDQLRQTYKWINGRPLTYTNWFNKQPDPRVGPYVKVTQKQGANQYMYWTAASENETLPFFCRILKVKATEAPVATSLQPSGNCSHPWIKIMNYCYYLNKERMSFPDAQQACSQMGKDANLVSFHSLNENELVFRIISNESIYFTWIGLSNEGIVNGFNWIDGRPISFINWDTNRPHTGLRHLCGGMTSGGKWMDLACYSKYPSLCKASLGSVYQPTTTTPPQSTTTPDPSLCGSSEWLYYNGSCYYFSNKTGLDWHNAKLACHMKNDSHLVSILDKNENNFIHGEVKRRYGTKNVLIGLNDMSIESGWSWEDGSIVKYLNFDENQPDNWHAMEDCGEFRYNGKWNDLSCNIQLPFICKKNKDQKEIHNTTAAPDTGHCLPGWKQYGRKCYLFMVSADENRDFQSATSYCRNFKGGDLVSIHHNYENAFIVSQLAGVSSSVYIGLSDNQVERRFIWNDQSSVDYTNWHYHQPSRYGDEDCVELLPFYKYHGRWNDINCNKKTGFVCQLGSTAAKPTATPTVTKAPSDPCPANYTKFQSACYRSVKQPQTWSDAQKTCEKDFGDLLSIHDIYEQAFVFSQMAEVGFESWIGLKGNNRIFKTWSDNTTVDYKYWISYSRGYNQNCVIQIFSSSISGKWKTADCSKVLPFICKISKKEVVVDPSFLGNCTSGWTKFGKLCYKVFSESYSRETWAGAREKCKGHGGDLVKVSSKSVQKQIEHLIRNTWESVWIGLNDRQEEHKFSWSDSTPLLSWHYKNWKQNEPNDNSGKENCVELASTTGRWNDISCVRLLPYVCEHPIECRDRLGIENLKVTASSYVYPYLPRNARLNMKVDGKSSAWCTNITDTKQWLQIDLGDLMTITRINTQGLFLSLSANNYVISYILEYSMDGANWMQYAEYDDSGKAITRLLPGNRFSSSIEGTTVNVKATHLRIVPVLHKGKLRCMRLELYGCKAVCSKPLGMGSFGIRTNKLKASSGDVNNARPSLTSPWCPKDSNPWYQIDLTRVMKVTRVSVVGNGFKGFELSFSNDAKVWRKSVTRKGTDKFFPASSKTHDLEVIEHSRYVKFEIDPTTTPCLQLELFGCTYECDDEMGMQSNVISDSMISASSSRTTNPPSNARLNHGSGWCAKTNDRSQFLQIDFQTNAHVTAIATQGVVDKNKVENYVTRYHLQWSTDGTFWHFLPKLLTGNSDGSIIQKVHLDQPISARFLRINPTEFNNVICMRVELYGCPLEKITPTEKPSQTYPISIRLTNEKYTSDLATAGSQAFTALAQKVSNAMTNVYVNNVGFEDGFKNVEVTGFRPGSVIVDVSITFYKLGGSDPLRPLKNAIQTGKLGNLVVDKKLDGGDTLSKKHTGSSGLSSAAKVGLIVFFVLIIVIIIIAGVIYFKRHRGNFHPKFKSFSNPVHMRASVDDDMDVQFMNEENN